MLKRPHLQRYNLPFYVILRLYEISLWKLFFSCTESQLGSMLFYVVLSHTGLEQHKGESVMTRFCDFV